MYAAVELVCSLPCPCPLFFSFCFVSFHFSFSRSFSFHYVVSRDPEKGWAGSGRVGGKKKYTIPELQP